MMHLLPDINGAINEKVDNFATELAAIRTELAAVRQVLQKQLELMEKGK